MSALLNDLHQFHFLRPAWLLAALAALLVAALLWRKQHRAQAWQQLVAPELLPYLLDGKSTGIKPVYWLGLVCAWLIACLALAGPTWEKRPTALAKNQQALVVILDLSPSMLSEDIKPSRLTRARLKIIDILQRRSDGYTGLVVYGGEAHAVTPLSEDSKTIINLLPDLSPQLMPLQGSNIEAAIERALQMLSDSGFNQGEILLLTDGVSRSAEPAINSLLQKKPQVSLSILGVGGTQPTPIPSSKGGFVRDAAGSIVTTQIEPEQLRNLALSHGGRYQTFSDTTHDIEQLLPEAHAEHTSGEQHSERTFDNWYDRGHWLVLLLLPLVLYSFRRGLVLCLLLLPLASLTPQPSYAFSWQDAWQNKNQQGQQALEQQQAEQAAELFTDPQWQASAAYRAGNYEQAAQGFAKDDSARGHYNRGNALAQAGKLDAALEAYNQALERDPTLSDAAANRQLVEQLKQQQEQQAGEQNDSQQQNGDEQNPSQQNQNGEGQENPQNGEQGENSASDNSGNEQSGNEQSGNEQAGEQTDEKNNAEQNGEQQNANAQNSDEQGQPLSEEEQAAEAKRQAQEAAEREAQQQARAASESDDNASETNADILATEPDDGLSNEERQALEQWLRRVPDEPGMLLKNKFQDQYRKRRMQMFNGDWQPPENGAAERW